MNELGSFIKEVREEKKLSKRALANAASISHTEIHRIENGERVNPSPPVLRAISIALSIPYEELMEKAGYINNPQEIAPLHKAQEYEGKFIEVLTPKLIKEGWTVEQCSPSSIADLLAKKDDVKWNLDFYYFGTSSKNNFMMDRIFKTYGKLAVYDGSQITQFTMVTNDNNAYNMMTKFAPINLKIKISTMLVDFDTNKVVEEKKIN